MATIPSGATLKPKWLADGEFVKRSGGNIVGTTLAVSDMPTGLKYYVKDGATPAHYWQLTVSVLGVLITADVGTTAPVDGIIFVA